MLFGGGDGGVIRQSINFQTANTNNAVMIAATIANQKPRDILDRFLGRGLADSLQRPFHEGLQPFHA